jgi:N-acetyl-anhydromuramoyl-L-alanine amidase
MSRFRGWRGKRYLPQSGCGDLKIDAQEGLIHPARHLVSPNSDERPHGAWLSLIVIHSISLPPAQFGGPWIDDLFLNRLDSEAHPFFATLRELRVSSHLLIRRDGSITQYVPFHRRAWHAGVSSYGGKSACNDFSIGIELEGTDTVSFEDAQYETVAQAAGVLIRCFPTLSAQHIAGHSDIAPGRKIDPGPLFDWQRFRVRLAETLADPARR